MSSSRETLAASAQHAILVRGSRFLADAAPIADAEEAMRWLASRHLADATHNAWAWRCGESYRSSDDGEPGGSAGRPILAAIDGQRLDQVVVRVARWFGGTKLGVGGLVRAYGGCAAGCLHAAPRRTLRTLRRVRIEADAGALAQLRGRLPRFEATAAAQDAATIGLRVLVPEEQVQPLREWLQSVTRGRGRCIAD